MKWVEEFKGNKGDIIRYLEELISKLRKDTLVVDSQKVDLPWEDELQCKVKYSEDEESIKLAFKISYDKEIEEEEAEM